MKDSKESKESKESKIEHSSRQLIQYSQQCQSMGLDLELLLVHAERIQLLTQLKNPVHNFTILETCRLNNGGLLPLTAFQGLISQQQLIPSTVAFIPAAGAASRYFAAFDGLKKALADENYDAIEAEHQIFAGRVDDLPLPAGMKQFYTKSYVPPSRHQIDNLLFELHLPKALLPAVNEGLTYLQVKHLEDTYCQGLVGQVFITPLAQKGYYENHFRTNQDNRSLATSFFEQSEQLSTIRFREDGKPFLDHKGRLSPVAAGHGALIELVPQVQKAFPQASTLFIKNIDNVIGWSDIARLQTDLFLAAHQSLLLQMKQIREFLQADNLQAAEETACRILAALAVELDDSLWKTLQDHASSPGLYYLQLRVFHTPEKKLFENPSVSNLLSLYQRPLNILGQVPNTGKDVGGIPVWVETDMGPAKVSLELPHISSEDQRDIFADVARATHFNPSFVAAEMFSDAFYYHMPEDPFWILARKKFMGQDVIYHETVLYELLGNSLFSNVIFVEIPRLLFNPNKAVADTRGRTLQQLA